MSNTQPAYRAFTVIKRGEGQDDYWLNIGAAFMHQDGEGFNIKPRHSRARGFFSCN